MGHSFTSLQGSIEKLLEAEYFLAGVATGREPAFRYNLNAFFSACRSVTFVLQKSMSGVRGFRGWYDTSRKQMKADPAMGFFLELRNVSQHEGPVSIVGGSISRPPGWSYRFAGNRESVPSTLIGRDVAAVCAEHLVKVARLLGEFLAAFPCESCIHAALTPDGMQKLGFSLDDAGRLLGLPAGYLGIVGDIPLAEKLRLLRCEFDSIDTDALQRIMLGQFQRDGEPLIFAASTGNELTDDIAALIESGDEVSSVPKMAFLTAVGRRIQAIDSDGADPQART
jgi:hypothetical protein